MIKKWGFRLSKREVLEKTGRYVNENKIPTPFRGGVPDDSGVPKWGGEGVGVQPTHPPKFRSFDKVEPDCKLSGKIFSVPIPTS